MIISKQWQPVQAGTIKRHPICTWYAYLQKVVYPYGIYYYGLVRHGLKPEEISEATWDDNEAYAAKSALDRMGEAHLRNAHKLLA